MNKIEFSKLEKKEDMIMVFNQLKDDYSLLFSDNQDLKKQLEESINSYTEENALRHKMSLELNTIKTQQKEFIELLEEKILRSSYIGEDGFGRIQYESKDIYYEINKILLKYKEIVGGKEWDKD